jgi:propionyl-CoA carboxylase alpha chain
MSGLPRTVLVANRGEIARRVFRTCRRLGIGTVAVFSDADADAPHVGDADAAVHLPGTASADTYLRGDLVIAAALAAGADAVHPGYGFLSEDAGFARAVLAAGLTWIGPPPDAIEAMGSKLAAKARMAAAGVPVLGGGDVTGLDDGAVRALAEATGYPVLVKASAGGGGRGMRLVESAEGLLEAVASAQREAAAAFGDGTVFVETYVVDPRHVEVQVLADAHGTVVHLFERECSIQRRHQKIVEEAPSPAVDDDLRRRMGEAAVAAAAAVGYEGAGTVELVLAADGTFAFLEMNTRLQVEHPVTEEVTDLDLVELQLRVAAGERLPPEVVAAELTGHAIEVRLYAEDPAEGYRPSTGTVDRFDVPILEGIRVETGVVDGSVVSPHYDPMLAKVIAWAPTRGEAARRLAAALRGARIHGVTTNRDLLVAVLEHEQFLAGATDTGFLDRFPAAELTASRRPTSTTRLHAVAAALAVQAANRDGATTWALAPSGWRNVPSQPQRLALRHGDDELVVTYARRRPTEAPTGARLTDAPVGEQGTRWRWAVGIDGDPVDGLVVHGATPELVDLGVGGVRRRVHVAAHGDRVDVDSSLGSTTFTVVPPFTEPGSALAAGSLVAPMPGSVVRVEVAAGDAIAAGQLLLVLEAMKMEHPVTAPAAGTVTEVAVAAGQQVTGGQVLAVVAVDGAADP